MTRKKTITKAMVVAMTNDNSNCNDKTISVVFHTDKTVCIRSNLYHCQDNDNDNSNCNCKCKTSFPNRQNTPHQVRSLYFVFVFVLCDSVYYLRGEGAMVLVAAIIAWPDLYLTCVCI